MIDKKFNWGHIAEDDWFLNVLKHEIIDEDNYQKFFHVEENDIVVDIGASVGPFSYSILDKNPKKVFCLEPHPELFQNLSCNLLDKSNVVLLNKGISDKNGKIIFNGLYNKNFPEMWSVQSEACSLTFETFIDLYNIEKIDFLKIDCEGGEYDVFNSENFKWIKNNVKKISGEWHLHNRELKDKFKEFRDLYLKEMQNHEIFSMDDVDIKWSLWDDWFIEYYSMIYVYIDNTKKNQECIVDNSKFDWGTLDQEYINLFKNENFIYRTYEEHQKVKTDDIVFDIGANYGSFTYSILNKNPKIVYCIEPSNNVVNYLQKNVSHGPVVIINKAISDKDGTTLIPERGVYIYEHDGDSYSTITFQKIINDYNISKIDFLKFDCEGGEYSIFTKENYNFIRNNVKNFAGEWHINDHENSVERFIEFRDLYLRDCSDIHVYERNGKDITVDIFNDQYLYDFRDWWKDSHLGQFIIHFSYDNVSKVEF
jgi:FkbM family methyltransferase